MTDIKFPDTDLSNTLLFLKEAGKLKSVIRQTFLQDSDRLENSAEHSWHLVLMAISLKNFSNEKINIERVIKMLSVHDLGEVYAGDTFFYDDDRDDAPDTEKEALTKLIEKTPPRLREEIFALWTEFEAKETIEAKYAQGLDRFQPFMEQLHNGGESWHHNKISYKTALAKNKHIKEGSRELWDLYQDLAKQAEEKGYFHKEE